MKPSERIKEIKRHYYENVGMTIEGACFKSIEDYLDEEYEKNNL